MNSELAAVLAHQGGWDEILLIGGPIVVIAGLLALAKRRVDRMVPVDAADGQDVDTAASVGVDADTDD